MLHLCKETNASHDATLPDHLMCVIIIWYISSIWHWAAVMVAPPTAATELKIPSVAGHL